MVGRPGSRIVEHSSPVGRQLGSRAMKTAFEITLSLSFGPDPSAMNGDSVSTVNLPSSVESF